MGRCVQLLCVWCLLSKVKVLRFNYQKMFAVGGVPRKARQGRDRRCPLCSWAGGRSCLGTPQDEPRGSELQHFHLTVRGSVDSCSVTPSAPWGLSGTPVEDRCRRQDRQETDFVPLLGRTFPQPLPWAMSPRHLTTGRGVGHGEAVRMLHP